jgi:hypothetical protein
LSSPSSSRKTRRRQARWFLPSMALNACPFRRHPAPIKCPPPPSPFPSFPQTREYTRVPRSLVGIRHYRRHNLFDSAVTERYRRSFLVHTPPQVPAHPLMFSTSLIP